MVKKWYEKWGKRALVFVYCLLVICLTLHHIYAHELPESLLLYPPKTLVLSVLVPIAIVSIVWISVDETLFQEVRRISQEGERISDHALTLERMVKKEEVLRILKRIQRNRGKKLKDDEKVKEAENGKRNISSPLSDPEFLFFMLSRHIHAIFTSNSGSRFFVELPFNEETIKCDIDFFNVSKNNRTPIYADTFSSIRFLCKIKSINFTSLKSKNSYKSLPFQVGQAVRLEIHNHNVLNKFRKLKKVVNLKDLPEKSDDNLVFVLSEAPKNKLLDEGKSRTRSPKYYVKPEYLLDNPELQEES